jgi:lipid II:glycine glycyltransferase (peptidoglycan interpeptide bridge formation enzyme)
MSFFTDGFSTEVDTVDKERWDEICCDFSDANIYQTWSHGLMRSGQSNVTYLLVKQKNAVVSAVQGRLVKTPLLNVAIVYIFWGPLWRRRGRVTDAEVFRQALRAIRAEYVGRRRLIVRIVPNFPDSDTNCFRRIIQEEAFVFPVQSKRSRTIVMDIRPTSEQLYQGLHQKWRNSLNKARKQNLELIEGETPQLFEAFEGLYAEMMQRKAFIDSSDPGLLRKLQAELLPDQRMRVFLCKSGDGLCAGGICSALGDTGLYLFGATSNRGSGNNSSYLVHWRMLEWIKSRGCQFYDLNGINPATNPGNYRFKSRLAGAYGCDVDLLGKFDAYPRCISRLLVTIVDRLRPKLKAAAIYLPWLVGCL